MDHLTARILYVDDDVDSCELMELFLRHPGKDYKITALTSVPEAAALISRSKVDLFVFDYCLSEMDAPEFCKYIREKDSVTPILIFSAMPEQKYRDLAIASGATAYLVKPNDLERLPVMVEALIDGQHPHSAGRPTVDIA
jgi:DNA-binding response OmpR family regulator